MRRLLAPPALAAAMVVAAAPPAWADEGGLLGPFSVPSSEGVPLDHYNLIGDPGGFTAIVTKVILTMIEGCFALARILVGMSCWLIEWAYRFPVMKAVATPAQQVADAYRSQVVDALGLPGLLLAWAFVICCIMIMRGKVARGLGELLLTLVISALAATALIRPDVTLGPDGVFVQAQTASVEIASITASRGQTASVDPHQAAAPITASLTRVFVADTYQLLQFGQPIGQDHPCRAAYDQALAAGPWTSDGEGEKSFHALAEKFTGACQPLADYMKQPTWERAFGALLVLVAAVVVLGLVLAMVCTLIAGQLAETLAAIAAYPVLTLALLPGVGRRLLWRWFSVFATSVLVTFTVSLFIPLFGVLVEVVLTDLDGGLIAGLMLVDLLAVAALAFHRRLIRGASRAGQVLAQRMDWARIGGSRSYLWNRPHAGFAYAELGAGGFGAGGAPSLTSALAGGGISATAALAGLAGDARAEVDRISTPIHAAQSAWVGKPLEAAELERRTIHPGDDGFLSAGERLHNRLLHTRGGRMMLGTGRTARLPYDYTIGLPATWTRGKAAADRARLRVAGEVQAHQQHYSRRLGYHVADWKAGAADLTRPVRLATTPAAQLARDRATTATVAATVATSRPGPTIATRPDGRPTQTPPTAAQPTPDQRALRQMLYDSWAAHAAQTGQRRAEAGEPE